MGTKVQCKSYRPGYNPMKGQDDDRNVSWSLFCDGKARNGHAYNEVMLKTVLGYSEYDKEMLKRTMLEHEAIFRKQVYELHRLYRTQKNLMDELKRKEMYRISLPKDLLCTSQASSFFSQAPPGDIEKKLHASHLSFGNVPLDFLNENRSSVQSCRSTVENGGSKEDELSSKSNRFPRRMLDLELPADVYIDNETGFAAAMQSGNNLKLSLGTGEDSGCKENSRRLDSRLKNRDLADLNEPAKECFDRTIGSASTFIFGTRTGCEVSQENKLPVQAGTTARSLQRVKGAECSSKELPFLGKDSGRSQCHLNSFGPHLYNEKAPIVSEAVELKLNRTNESHSPVDSSWRKPTNKINHIPIAVQALPCFNKPPTMNLQFNHNSSNHTSFISDKPNRNGNHCSSAFGASEGHRSPKCFKSLHCIDVKSAKDLNLNEACPNDIVDGVGTKQDTLRKLEESSGGIPWLRNKPTCERNAAQSYTQLLANCATTSSGFFERKPNNGEGLFTSNAQELQQTLEMNEPLVSLSAKRHLGFPFAETIKQGDIQTQLLTDNVKCNEGVGIRFERASGSKSSRNQINLNSSSSLPKIILDIDLEAPLTCQADDQSAETDYTFKVDCLNKTESLHEQCVREAAESIFAISRDTFNNADKLTCHETLVTEFNALSWFAEVVLSSDMEKELKGEDYLGSESLDDDGLDLFESMTLKLEEIKVEELQCDSQGQDDQEEQKGSAALLLLTKPRRGSARKRRQKRDFQKDILPGLATLSRHEVIEDLKTIEGLVRSAGGPWLETSPTRRKAQTRGRGRPRSLPVVEPVSEPKNAKPVVDDKSIIGWGRTTRRCRRPRCPQGSVAAPLV